MKLTKHPQLPVDSDLRYPKLSRSLRSYCGAGMPRHRLTDWGIKVQRMRLHDSIHRADEDGVKNRKRGCLCQRT